MTFHKLSTYFEQISSESSRLAMTDILAELFGDCRGEEVAAVCYLMTARVAPMFIPVEFNVAEKSVLKVLQGIVDEHGGKEGYARDQYDEIGDLGKVASKVIEEFASKTAKSKQRSILDVYDKMWEIAAISGIGSVGSRNDKISGLLTSGSPIEAKYIVRILLDEMRLGSSDKTVLDALSVLKKGDKQDRDELDRAFGVGSDLGYIAAKYVDGGKAAIKKITVTPGIPVFSMLVEREKEAGAIMKRIPRAIVQPKFDGLRCQIHIGINEERDFTDRLWWKRWDEFSEDDPLSLFGAGKEEYGIRLFSRNLEDMTDMFPDVVTAARDLKVDSAVFDSEIIGYNEDTGEFVPFQETMKRKRKYGIADASMRVPVKAFVFDVIHLDGLSLLKETNEWRLDKLSKLLDTEGLLVRSGNHIAGSADELQKLFDEYVSEGLEGVIVKDPASSYRPGSRVYEWIKLKRASQGHLADTVDVVILGYYFGRGRQAEMGIGALLGGVYDESADMFFSICKIGTGITDEKWREIKIDLDDIAVDVKPKRADVSDQLAPDQWVEPEIVATVEADEITKSPVHTAGRGEGNTGYALRFPRLKIWRRDKLPCDATSIEEIEKMYKKQG
jgi:DNA ligase 1